MPRVSIVIIRTALLQLAIGALLGGLLLAEKGLHLAPLIWTLRPGHIQMMLIGWTVQFACGTAIWILPRLEAAGGRGNQGLAWLAYVALNAGVLITLLHNPLARLMSPASLDWMPTLAGLLYAVAVAALVAQLWRRVRPFHTHLRPMNTPRES